jgi:hypothetical protein
MSRKAAWIFVALLGLSLQGLFLQGCIVVAHGGWTLLGRREVDFGRDHDAIEVGRAEGRFRHLRFAVYGGDIELYDMRVTFGDGQSFHPELRFHFREGSDSQVIDLPGDARLIRRVDFVYRSTGRRQGKAVLSLFGR